MTGKYTKYSGYLYLISTVLKFPHNSGLGTNQEVEGKVKPGLVFFHVILREGGRAKQVKAECNQDSIILCFGKEKRNLSKKK